MRIEPGSVVPTRHARQGRERALGEPALGPFNGLLYCLYARYRRAG